MISKAVSATRKALYISSLCPQRGYTRQRRPPNTCTSIHTSRLMQDTREVNCGCDEVDGHDTTRYQTQRKHAKTTTNIQAFTRTLYDGRQWDSTADKTMVFVFQERDSDAQNRDKKRDVAPADAPIGSSVHTLLHPRPPSDRTKTSPDVLMPHETHRIKVPQMATDTADCDKRRTNHWEDG